MTFPSANDVEFFSQPEAREFFGARWEPKFGDWAVLDDDKKVVTIIYVEENDVSVEHQNYAYGSHWCRKAELIPLPRPDQLIEMLEEKGYKAKWDLTSEVSLYQMTLFFGHDAALPFNSWFGPTPAIALARCVMEVMKETSDENYQAE